MAQLSELYHASLRPISPDKPLPDESGFMDAPCTPWSNLPYRILYTDRARPLQPSDFAATCSDDSDSSQKESSSEDTSTDTSSSSSSSETTLPLNPYLWAAILMLASLCCVLSFVLVAIVSDRRMMGPTATPDEAALIVDPIHFVARHEPDILTAGFDEVTDEAASTAWPQVEVAGQAGLR